MIQLEFSQLSKAINAQLDVCTDKQAKNFIAFLVGWLDGTDDPHTLYGMKIAATKYLGVTLPVEEAVSSSPKTEELGNNVSSTEMDSGAQAQIQKHINETHH